MIVRVCDPFVAQQCSQLLPKLLGNVWITAVTDDGNFIDQLSKGNFDVCYLGTGFIRWSMAGKQIPGSNETTNSWSADDYKRMVISSQGEKIAFVDTPRESEVMVLLCEALGLSYVKPISESDIEPIYKDNNRPYEWVISVESTPDKVAAGETVKGKLPIVLGVKQPPQDSPRHNRKSREQSLMRSPVLKKSSLTDNTSVASQLQKNSQVTETVPKKMELLPSITGMESDPSNLKKPVTTLAV